MKKTVRELLKPEKITEIMGEEEYIDRIGLNLLKGEKLYEYRGGVFVQTPDGKFHIFIINEEYEVDTLQAAEWILFEQWAMRETVPASELSELTHCPFCGEDYASGCSEIDDDYLATVTCGGCNKQIVYDMRADGVERIGEEAR